MSLTLDLVSVPVSDQDRAKAFYIDVLGFKALQDNKLNDSIRWIMLEAPRGGMRIALVTWFDSMPAGSMRGGVLACDHLEDTLASLDARGATFDSDKIMEAPWGRWKQLVDPDGNMWIVQQHAKQEA